MARALESLRTDLLKVSTGERAVYSKASDERRSSTFSPRCRRRPSVATSPGRQAMEHVSRWRTASPSPAATQGLRQLSANRSRTKRRQIEPMAVERAFGQGRKDQVLTTPARQRAFMGVHVTDALFACLAISRSRAANARSWRALAYPEPTNKGGRGNINPFQNETVSGRDLSHARAVCKWAPEWSARQRKKAGITPGPYASRLGGGTRSAATFRA
jgi:hypothetical protein